MIHRCLPLNLQDNFSGFIHIQLPVSSQPGINHLARPDHRLPEFATEMPGGVDFVEVAPARAGFKDGFQSNGFVGYFKFPRELLEGAEELVIQHHLDGGEHLINGEQPGIQPETATSQ